MRKMKMSALAIQFLLEILLFFSAIVLVRVNFYCFVLAIVAGLAACATCYFLVEGLHSFFSEYINTKNRFFSEKIDTILHSYDKIEKGMMDFMMNQSQFAKENLNAVESLRTESSSLLKHFSEESQRVFADNQKLLEEYRVSGEAEKQMYKENISRVQQLYSESLEKINVICTGHYESLKNAVQEYTEELQKKEEAYLQHVSDRLIGFHNENLQKLEMDYKKLLQEQTDIQIRNYQGLLKDTGMEFKEGMIKLEPVLDAKISKLSERYNEIMIACSEGYLKNLVKEITEVEEVYYKDMTQAIDEYSDSLVSRSAVAIAEVQKDNNLKLQELSGRLSELAVSENEFLQNFQRINNEVKTSVEMLISYQKEETAIGQERTLGYIAKVRDLLNQNSEQFYKMYQSLAGEQTGQYAEAMKDYRDIFIQANAKALANVEKRNIEMIQQTAENVGDVVESIEKLKGHTEQNTKNMMALIMEFQNTVKRGNENQEENFRLFNEGFESEIESLSDEIRKSFRIYQNETKMIAENIENVTNEYHKLFDQVIKNQNDMNGMTREDIELIKSIVEM